MKPISVAHIVAYAHCSRKAFFLLCTDEKGHPNEYEKWLDQFKKSSAEGFTKRILQDNPSATRYYEGSLKKGHAYIVDVQLQTEALASGCTLLTKVSGKSFLGRYHYQPAYFTGTQRITKEDKLAMAFLAELLGNVQGKIPVCGSIINSGGKVHTVKIENSRKLLKTILRKLNQFETVFADNPPKPVLNKHCPYCQFQHICKAQAEREDNLSLLDRITEKQIARLEKKGILTVKQLSYVYKPRRRGRRSQKPNLTFKPELQALAIRTGKVYIQQIPAITRKPVELFLDIEGIPDRDFYYLFGLLVQLKDTEEYHSFWANENQEEEQAWNELCAYLNQFLDCPIYHYGSFESNAVDKLAKRYTTDVSRWRNHLVNINSFVYGKVYFPAYSNSLKELGKIAGARWTAKNASGLQSIVWRYHWEQQAVPQYKDWLITYNREDCQALKLLTAELSRIAGSADTAGEVDFIRKPKKIATETSQEMHDQFQSILQLSYSDYNKKKIKFRNEGCVKEEPLKRSGFKNGFQGQRLKRPKPTKKVRIGNDKFCYKHPSVELKPSKSTSKRLIIDLVFIRNGIRKTVTQYIGQKGYCSVCMRSQAPALIRKYGITQVYGHNYKVWFVYQRLVMRLPYEKIALMIKDTFKDDPCWSYCIRFVSELAEEHSETEKRIFEKLLQSSFIHADETPVSIRGATQYVWVFTSDQYVIFKLSASREAAVPHAFLKNYRGVLITDFFAGYDGINCRQQKCWVHFIRDLNNDLWEVPFDKEFEKFVAQIRSLLIPMMETIHKYGLKHRHLGKYRKEVAKFYKKYIDGQTYISEYCNLYQKRFIRYRDSLFTFLEDDGISWHNNTAELAIRHVAKQRTISGYFHESRTPHYLTLVGIMQTCRFQKKSFLKFLLSGEKDIDKFKR